MRVRVEWSPAELQPTPAAVLRSQRLPSPPSTPPRIAALLQEAMETYLRLAEPRAVLQLVDQPAFARIYRGEGRNIPDAPLERIVPRAAALALFVATAGATLSEAISRMFSRGDPARAYMLDAVASEAADGLAVGAGAALISALRRAGTIAAPTSVLPYSPGYCGWDLTGQRALFASIVPDDIGITLNASCLMQPLKSVSGVLVVGPPEVHAFQPEFACCDACRTRLCRHRIATLHLQ